MTHPLQPDDVWQQTTDTPRLMVVSGEIGSGKTSWCSALIDVARSQGATVGGMLSPGVFEGGSKMAIDLLHIASREKRRLAQRRAAPDITSPTPNWQFDEEVLQWGNTLLSGTPACDLLVVDEIGPLELTHGRGLHSVFDVLQRRQYRLACVVVRTSLADVFGKRCKVDQTFYL